LRTPKEFFGLLADLCQGFGKVRIGNIPEFFIRIDFSTRVPPVSTRTLRFCFSPPVFSKARLRRLIPNKTIGQTRELGIVSDQRLANPWTTSTISRDGFPVETSEVRMTKEYLPRGREPATPPDKESPHPR